MKEDHGQCAQEGDGGHPPGPELGQDPVQRDFEEEVGYEKGGSEPAGSPDVNAQVFPDIREKQAQGHEDNYD